MLIGMKRTKEEVARIAKARMDELRLTTTQLAKDADVDFNTVRDFIAGKRKPNEANRVKLNDALRWKPGGLHDAYKGADPVPLPHPDPPLLRIVSDDDLLAEVRRRMRGDRYAVEAAPTAGASDEASEGQEVSADNPKVRAGRRADAVLAADLKGDSLGDDAQQPS